MRRPTLASLSAVLILAGCSAGVPSSATTSAAADSHGRLPTGARLDPAAPLHDVGQMPLAMLNAPERDRVVLLLNGWREDGVQVVERATGTVLQTIRLPAVFLGLAFSPDGRTLYASGGNTDQVYVLDWRNGAAALRDSILLRRKPNARAGGTSYPSGLALSRDGRRLYVAENLADSLAVVDVASGTIVQRLATGRYPYAVVVSPSGEIFVSNWGGTTVSTYASSGDGMLRATAALHVGRHPSAMVLGPRANRLFVALASMDRVVSVDLSRRRVIGELLDPPPAGPAEGSTPNALALTSDGTRLLVAEADNNAVAVFDLSAATSGIAGAAGDDLLAGRIPTGWYPTALALEGDALMVAAAKGRGTRANPDGPNPAGSRERSQAAGPANTTLSQLSGAVMQISARVDRAALSAFSARTARANGWNGVQSAARAYPPIEHVIYVVKENRTYDQIMGDHPGGDGDTSLVHFPRAITPNQHALADRFGLFDRFFVNAEVSADGHNWSMAAYTTDYLQKTVQMQYSQRGRSYDFEGTEGRSIQVDDVNAPARGYLWDLAQQRGITFRNYGEFVVSDSTDPDDVLPAGYRGNKPFLASHTNPAFPGYDLGITDQRRADVWLAELAEFTKRGVMPALEIVRLPNDHTAGARAGSPTPRAMVADNDVALGRMIEGLSRSPFWRNTVVFVLEDDAQNGPDHVDSHRAPMLVISPWVRAGSVHRFVNTTDVLRTIEELLDLDALSQFDHFGRPLRDIWAASPDARPYSMLASSVSLTERNAPATRDARQSSLLDLRMEDMAEEDAFNRIIWRSVRGSTPYPGARRGAALEAIRR